jgi:hypothetical protein
MFLFCVIKKYCKADIHLQEAKSDKLNTKEDMNHRVDIEADKVLRQ